MEKANHRECALVRAPCGSPRRARLGGFSKAGQAAFQKPVNLVSCPFCQSNVVLLTMGNFEGDWKHYKCCDCEEGFFIWQVIKVVRKRRRKRNVQAG